MLTSIGYSAADIGKSLSWRSFKAFILNIGTDTAVARELYPDYSAWGTREKTNAILADIFDVLSAINANLMAIGSGKRPKPPKPYPRPGANNNSEKKIGKGALPVKDLEAFFERKRREHIERHDRSRKSDSHDNTEHGRVTGQDRK